MNEVYYIIYNCKDIPENRLELQFGKRQVLRLNKGACNIHAVVGGGIN